MSPSFASCKSNNNEEKKEKLFHERISRLAHEYRFMLASGPRQSSFRVVALVFLKLPLPNTGTSDDTTTTDEINDSSGMEKSKTQHQQSSSSRNNIPQNTVRPSPVVQSLFYWDVNDNEPSRPYLVGTNSESCWIGNSICAERSALTLLRWYPCNTITVDCIVVATDSPEEVTPGLLCREFMASMDSIPWTTPIILACTTCTTCHAQCTTAEHIHQPCASDTTKHNFVARVTTLQDLYPFPSLYVRMPPLKCLDLGKHFANTTSNQQQQSQIVAKLFEMTRLALKEQDWTVSTTRHLHPISYAAAAAILFDNCAADGDDLTRYISATCIKSLEYGCSLDAVTQLCPALFTILAAANDKKVKEIWLVQVDQFGLAHAPFAPARAVLIEQGLGNVVRVLVHQQEECLSNHHQQEDEQRMAINGIQLKTVLAKQLAPNVPASILDAVSKNHHDATSEKETIE